MSYRERKRLLFPFLTIIQSLVKLLICLLAGKIFLYDVQKNYEQVRTLPLPELHFELFSCFPVPNMLTFKDDYSNDENNLYFWHLKLKTPVNVFDPGNVSELVTLKLNKRSAHLLLGFQMVSSNVITHRISHFIYNWMRRCIFI